MSLLIRGGTVVTPAGSARMDIRVEDGKISEVGKYLLPDGEEIVDAAGCLVFPGFIDAHTHLDMNNGVTMTADDFYSGTKAALVGGTTTIVDFATQEKGGTLKEALAEWHDKADGVSSCDYGFHMAITDWNREVSEEVAELVRAGVTSFKVYLAYDNLRVTDAQLYEVLRCVHENHGIVGVHCENGDLVNELVAQRRAAGQLAPEYHPLTRPNAVEAEAAARLLYIAQIAEAPVHIVHLSTREALREVRRARRRGQKVYVETCPQYLMLDESRYRLPGFEGAKYVISPPLRSKKDRQVLWDAVSGGEIDSISTDHCSFDFEHQKELGKEDFSRIPNGMPGLETRPGLMYTYGVGKSRMTREQMAAMLSENTARLFGMYPQKGALLPGSDADLVIWERRRGVITAKRQIQNVDYTPYEGIAVSGRPKMVYLHGTLVVKDGKIVSESHGRYIRRGASEYFKNGGDCHVEYR